MRETLESERRWERKAEERKKGLLLSSACRESVCSPPHRAAGRGVTAHCSGKGKSRARFQSARARREDRDKAAHLSCWMRSSPSLITLTVTCRVVCCCWPKRLMRSCTASTDSAYTSSSSSFCSSSSHVHSCGGQSAVRPGCAPCPPKAWRLARTPSDGAEGAGSNPLPGREGGGKGSAPSGPREPSALGSLQPLPGENKQAESPRGLSQKRRGKGREVTLSDSS